ncbi:DegT/DnrJ/EryC1/StrS aminotransferase family protein [Pigmentiphaga aceris]|uniref:DegT/DnrJ/EryC1/StrS aminotransferase family protein n=1 Tax=Pigmentiphaga aceris TaxID=1940612 RepID=A0A5C0B3T0_9BURK|nr:DegT/DnrJ/EryC1/StrS aminotransferase family protein [Pigmentiphaga aceris]QEI07187.1 DegT/DnrJ/EryC1/StrS aminotransferase family protein [Pigmentiphaga aceris]
MLNTPFAPWPAFTAEEVDAVRRVLLSNQVNYWTGEEGREFEREFAEWCQTEYAVALNNGTLALDAALYALGIGPGDDVIVTPRTFFASVSCIVNAGARPIFADVDLDSQNITADSIREVITPNTRAIICVHLAGMPCDMDPIMALAANHGLYVIEDCAQAHGARYKGRPVGSIGHIGTWSFCQDKIISTGGEGGMVTTNDRRLWSAMWSFKDHGKSWDAIYNRQKPFGFNWVHESFGTNARMLEVQAAIGRIQLRRLDQWVSARQANLARLHETAQWHPAVRVPVTPNAVEHAAYRGYLFIQPDQLAAGWNRDRILSEINAAGVPCYHGSSPEVYLERAFSGTGLVPPTRLPNAALLGETSLAFLVHPTLSNEDMDKTVAALDEVLPRACATRTLRRRATAC